MSRGVPGEIRERPNRQCHQAHEEEGGESQDAVNHLSFRNQVHKIPGYQEGLARGDHQRNADIHGAMAEGDIRGRYSNQRAEQQSVKYEEIAPNVMAEMFRMLVGGMRVAHNIKANIKPGTGKSRRDRQSAKTTRRFRCGW